jgi:leader peptidase (prepilin peptidase) / N-methyltransferase
VETRILSNKPLTASEEVPDARIPIGRLRAVCRSKPGPASFVIAGTAAIAAAIASLVAAPGIPGLLGSALAAAMVAIAAVDARSFIIPDKLVLVAFGAGIIDALAAQHAPPAAGLSSAVLRGALLALLFFAFRGAYRRIREREGIGLGDVKLVAVAGIWLTWSSFAVAIDLAAGAALTLVLIQFFRGRRVTETSAIPFGLFFAPAIWLAWLFETLSTRLSG